MLTEPTQTVYNTLYFQKIFESDPDFGVASNTPVNEYLSRLINLNMKTLLNSNFNNCILSGFDVVVTNTTDNKLYLSILPGTAILNSYLFELLSVQEDIEIIVNPGTNYLMVSLAYKNYDKNFSIKFDILDENKNNLVSNTDVFDELLPIKLFRLELKDNKITLLSLEDDNLYFGTNAEIYNILNMLYLESEYTNKLSKCTPLNKLIDLPKDYVINNKTYLIPNYGKHYDFAAKLARLLKNNKNVNLLNNHILNLFESVQSNDNCYI